MRKTIAAAAFVLLALSGSGALAQPRAKSICYHVSFSMWGSVVLPERTVCVPCPVVGCPPFPAAPSNLEEKP